MFELTKPLDELVNMLLSSFAGRTLTMQQIYESHSVGRPFVESNYRKALLNLEKAGRIKADPPAVKRRRHKGEPTFAPTVMVTFAKAGAHK